MKWMRHLALVLVALALAACGTAPQQAAKTPSSAQAPGQIRSMLWVGNSFFYYNNSMHGHVGQLLMGQSDNGKRNVRNVSATISGSGINWHDVEAHFKPGGVSSYSFVGDNEVRFNTFIPSCKRFSTSTLKSTARPRASTAPNRFSSCPGPIRTNLK